MLLKNALLNAKYYYSDRMGKTPTQFYITILDYNYTYDKKFYQISRVRKKIGNRGTYFTRLKDITNDRIQLIPYTRPQSTDAIINYTEDRQIDRELDYNPGELDF